MEDGKLISGCIVGDAQAWRMFVDRVSPVIWNIAWRFCGASGGHSAEEVCQNTFLRLLANDKSLLRRFEPARASLERYVSVVARSCALDYLRSVKRAPAADADSESVLAALAAEEPSGFSDIEDWEISAAISTLTAQERNVIEFLYRQEFEVSAVAEALQVTPSSVRSVKSHALKKLRQFFVRD